MLATAASAASTPRRSFLPPGSEPSEGLEDQTLYPDPRLFDDTLDALKVLQEAYFQPWVGTWPSAIDWTAAVMGSHIAGTLKSLSKGLEVLGRDQVEDFKKKENTISLYFSQLIGFYFGQDAFSLRNQAFDDMLWVVLGWLDTIKFIKEYSKTHYEANLRVADSTEPLHNQTWHGELWSPAFAHRARIFWHLASTGWDTKLCGGGMNWNPRLTPYKNAITNELYIAGSIAMYLHFPGDSNAAPFGVDYDPELPDTPTASEWAPRDPKYLAAAVKGYVWLASSGMTNDQGLYADGFHISGYKRGSNNTQCDQRDEMVYTYNQGVLLSGQRGLFEVSGRVEYIQEGHKLIQSVIRATGWNLGRNQPVDNLQGLFPGQLPPWHGLGRAGVLEDACDVTATCSQDAQTFKGIWMHHFTEFCAPLGELSRQSSKWGMNAVEAAKKDHISACKSYLGWLKHNADAARRARNLEGKFGMWWTVGLLGSITTTNIQIGPDTLPKMDGAVDYRNKGVPNEPEWTGHPTRQSGVFDGIHGPGQRPMGESSNDGSSTFVTRGTIYPDPNDRGRGRTVETQSGGLAVLRALWELSKLR